MKKSLIYSIITTTIIILFFVSLERLLKLTHPISLGILLVSYAVILGIIICDLSISWIAYLLILVFLGGVIVLIIYICTLSANEKIFFKKTNIFIKSLILFFFFLIIFSERKIILFTSQTINSLRIIYERRNLLNLIGLIIFLLITLVAVVKLVKFESGPIIKRL